MNTEELKEQLNETCNVAYLIYAEDKIQPEYSGLLGADCCYQSLSTRDDKKSFFLSYSDVLDRIEELKPRHNLKILKFVLSEIIDP